MIYLFGTMFILASLLLSLTACVGYALTIRGSRAALIYGRVGVFGSLVTVSALWLMLVALFLARRFEIAYVFQYSSTSLDTFFTIAASWAGQPGSFALWALFSTIVAVLLVGHTRHFEPYVLTIFMAVQTILLILVLIGNPFAPLTDPQTGMLFMPPPTEGHGLNPLLHNFWMIIHPPVVFLGYALTTVPFAFALGGLLRYDYDGWVVRALPWTLAAWAFLGLGILLGAYWAYETLGWGGYWAWDPVENSSLVPWLVLTALLHSMLVQRTHGGLRRTNVVLSIVAYLTVAYATFLTRSGVLSNFSVHSYVAAGMQSALVIFMLVILVSSLVIVLRRLFDMPIRSLNAHFLSRDNFLVLGTLVLLVIGTIVVLGTSMPVISAIPGVGHTLQDIFGSTFEINDGSAMTGQPLEDGRFNLAPSFYETTTPILALVMMVLLVFAPLLGWHEANPRTLLRTMRWPFVAAVVSTIIAIILGVRQGMSLAFILVSILAMGTNILTIVRTVRGGGGWLFVGGQVAHVGLCLLILGVIGSKVYASPDERVIISTDETVSIYGFDLTFQGWEATQDGEGNPDGKGVLNLTISRGGSNFTARPEIYFDQTMGGVMQTPSVHSRLWYDLYVSPVEYMGENDPNRPFLEAGETVSAGPYDLTFQGYSIDEDTIGQDGKAKLNAELTVAYEGSETTVMPQIEIDVGEEDEETTFREIPTTLPGGHTISTAMEELNSSQRMSMLTQRMAILNIEGLDLPIQPAQAVLTVSTKPLMILVWAGVIICLLGGGIAAFRRHIEGQLRLGRVVRVPVPPGMAEQV